ncbi:MAG: hypothetical protein K6U89_09505 [Chloroflexi bacterium]|nr:hypothetical protein [Chloroflexota bacterium]GIW10365.1 MAG: hypothetical protein KatS3mg061_1422 [Dehalococcoidia bacterium]
MKHLAEVAFLLPADVDPAEEAVQLAIVFEEGDPLPPGAEGLDLCQLERGPFPIEGVAPRAPAGAVLLTSVSARATLWQRLARR